MVSIKHFLKRTFWWWLAILLAVGWVFFLEFRPRLNIAPGQTPFADGFLVLDFGAGQKRFFQGAVDEQTTVLLALQSATQGADIALDYYLDANNAVKIRRIDGQTNFLGKGLWQFYLNQHPVQTEAIHQILIQQGDQIEARFQ